MHKIWARALGAGLAAGGCIFNFMNIVKYGENTGGILTFLYIATALAIIGSIFMFYAYLREKLIGETVIDSSRGIIIKNKMIMIIAFIIIDVVYLIPAIDWTTKQDGSTWSGTYWIVMFIFAIIFQTGATIYFIYYSKVHCQLTSHINGGYISHPVYYYHQAPGSQAY